MIPVTAKLLDEIKLAGIIYEVIVDVNIAMLKKVNNIEDVLLKIPNISNITFSGIKEQIVHAEYKTKTQMDEEQLEGFILGSLGELGNPSIVNDISVSPRYFIFNVPFDNEKEADYFYSITTRDTEDLDFSKVVRIGDKFIVQAEQFGTSDLNALELLYQTIELAYNKIDVSLTLKDKIKETTISGKRQKVEDVDKDIHSVAKEFLDSYIKYKGAPEEETESAKKDYEQAKATLVLAYGSYIHENKDPYLIGLNTTLEDLVGKSVSFANESNENFQTVQAELIDALDKYCEEFISELSTSELESMLEAHTEEDKEEEEHEKNKSHPESVAPEQTRYEMARDILGLQGENPEE